MQIFWSYARLDDKPPPRKLSALRGELNRLLDEAAGGSTRIVSDRTDLPWGVEWRERIERLIRESDASIPVLTPSFFNSRVCIEEFEIAERSGVRVLPLLYRRPKQGLRSEFVDSSDENRRLNESSMRIATHQYRDFTELRNKALTDESVAGFLDRLAEELA